MRVWVWHSDTRTFRDVEAEITNGRAVVRGQNAADTGVYQFWGTELQAAKDATQTGIRRRLAVLRKEVQELTAIAAEIDRA
jgi:hypothetical protein